MIAHLEGTLRQKAPEKIVLDVHGVGYAVHIPLSTFYALPSPGERIALHVHTHVREDALLLFGFATLSEKDMFQHLIAIPSVGPKLAVAILSGIQPEALRETVMNQDRKRLQKIPGIGKKTAERILLELKDRLGTHRHDEPSSRQLPSSRDGTFSDAYSALINLGYRPSEATRALDAARRSLGEEPPLEKWLKEALKHLG